MTKKNRKFIYPETLHDIVNYMIYKTARIMRMKFQNDMRSIDLDITQEQYFILIKLWALDGQYQAELADEIFQDNPNITSILDNMEKKKLIVRKPDKNDRRKFRIFLTQKAKDIYNTYKTGAPESRKLDYKHLNDKDFDDLKRILSTIEANILNQ